LDGVQAGREQAIGDLALKQVRPDPKEQPVRQRKYRRKVASPKQWAAIRAEKLDGRLCRLIEHIEGVPHEEDNLAAELHHLVPRSMGGDDVADNLVGLCHECHRTVTENIGDVRALVAESLTDAEYAYCIGKLGEGAMERLFGVGARA
jgi:hypothetical protein